VCDCNLPGLHLYSTAGSALASWIEALAVQSVRVLALCTRRCGGEGTNLTVQSASTRLGSGKKMLLITMKGTEGGPELLKAQASNCPPVMLAPHQCPTIAPHSPHSPADSCIHTFSQAKKKSTLRECVCSLGRSHVHTCDAGSVQG
jgi:hypothetical protein